MEDVDGDENQYCQRIPDGYDVKDFVLALSDAEIKNWFDNTADAVLMNQLGLGASPSGGIRKRRPSGSDAEPSTCCWGSCSKPCSSQPQRRPAQNRRESAESLGPPQRRRVHPTVARRQRAEAAARNRSRSGSSSRLSSGSSEVMGGKIRAQPHRFHSRGRSRSSTSRRPSDGSISLLSESEQARQEEINTRNRIRESARRGSHGVHP